MNSDTTTTRRRVLAGTAAVGLGSATLVPSTATATHDKGFFDGPVVNDEDSSRTAIALATVSGSVARFRLKFADLSDAKEIGLEVQDHFNEYSEDYLTYVNDRDLGSSSREVFKLEIDQDGDRDDRYLVSTYGNDEYVDAEIMDKDAFGQLDRTVDEETLLSGPAAANAPEELERLHEEFVEPNEDITAEYATEMGAKYGGKHVASSLLGDDDL